MDSEISPLLDTPREQASQGHVSGASSTDDEDPCLKPPVFTNNLSKPPQERYAHVTPDFTHITTDLPALFNEICLELKPRFLPMWFIRVIAWLFLRHLSSREHTLKLRGFSDVFQIPMYLLIVYNILLDLMMSCTSGGMLIDDSPNSPPRMMHFRALDWRRFALRKLLAQYDYVEHEGGPVVATTIGPSIASILRDLLFTRLIDVTENVSMLLKGGCDYVAVKLEKMDTPTAYVILCSGRETIVLEKDLRSARLLRSMEFITVTNHDEATEYLTDALTTEASRDVPVSR
ncbi:hypothetical protein T440DRAFT_522887 [Plenodomus tracheiphilus IPT5]|uniref:ceramidase n=1 Tax=Plenodomus tracheiphilus IPT5 TaxID=1408161 RepID=A0A6A7ASD3_9PLEO|nr:hypothetical protein T440DRAFT_522887 [Plenodomus tracheiphilus IPT5]